jgi:hypothetical protein
MQQLIANRIQTPDGTILQSYNRHDYKTHLDANGEVYMVDGGLDYQRRSINQVPATDLCVYVGDDHQHIRSAFCWGTYGKCGTLPRRWVMLADLSTDHIEAILDTQTQIAGWLRDVFETELQFRVTT